MTKFLTNRLSMKEQLYTLCMAKGTSIRTHISDFNSIFTNLASLDVKIDKEDQAILLLCSLPTSYKYFREIILYGKDTISIEDVKSSLPSKENIDSHLNTSVSGSNMGDALVGRDKGKKIDIYGGK